MGKEGRGGSQGRPSNEMESALPAAQRKSACQVQRRRWSG